MHNCSKEVELAEMHKDIKHVISLLEGNGVEGIVTKVTTNTNYRHEQIGKNKTLKWLMGSGWVCTMIVLMLNIFGVV